MIDLLQVSLTYNITALFGISSIDVTVYLPIILVINVHHARLKILETILNKTRRCKLSVRHCTCIRLRLTCAYFRRVISNITNA